MNQRENRVDIGGLRTGQTIEDVFVLKKMVEREYNGNAFLLFQFGNATGTLNGVMWGRVEPVVERFRVGDIVRVRGEMQEYQGLLQVRVHRVDAIDESRFDRSSFLPQSSRDMRSLMDAIGEFASSIVDEDYRRLVAVFYQDPAFLEAFERSPAGRAWHHSYVGGLAEHVHDMLQLADKAAEIYPEINRDLLITGILLHDIGKLTELEADGSIQYTDEGRLVGHILIGLRMIDREIEKLSGFPQKKALLLRHMVASHQGRGDQGSPKVPMTLEALLLHYIDDLDAQVTGARQVVRGHRPSAGSWTEYVKLLDRAFFVGDGQDFD